MTAIAQIPQTADAFKAWADRECGKWPMELTAEAYPAWLAMKAEIDPVEALFEFTESYRKWEATASVMATRVASRKG